MNNHWVYTKMEIEIIIGKAIAVSFQSNTLLFILLPAAAAAAMLLQLCPTLCDPIDGSPPGSPIPGILQARTLEWVAISFSNAWKWKVKVKSLSCVQLLATSWTAAHQAPLSMGFSRQEYWSGVPLPSPNLLAKYLKRYNISGEISNIKIVFLYHFTNLICSLTLNFTP